MKSVVCPGDASTVCGAYDHILIYSLDDPDPNTLDDPNFFFFCLPMPNTTPGTRRPAWRD